MDDRTRILFIKFITGALSEQTGNSTFIVEKVDNLTISGGHTAIAANTFIKVNNATILLVNRCHKMLMITKDCYWKIFLIW
jgi:hypothetical protein